MQHVRTNTIGSADRVARRAVDAVARNVTGAGTTVGAPSRACPAPSAGSTALSKGVGSL